MGTSRRQFAAHLAALSSLSSLSSMVAMSTGGLFSSAAFAQTDSAAFPNKPIRYVVPFAPGGLTDVMARLMGQKLSEGLKNPVLIDNKPGANANLGADLVAKALPDGYTWLAVTLAHAVNASLFTNLPYSIEKNLMPVVHLANSPLVLVVNANSTFKNLNDFLEQSKSKQLNGGSSGNGTAPHLGLELLSGETKRNFTHIPYKGGALSLNDLMGAQIDFIVANLPEAIAFIKSGKLRALAVTSAQRHALLPTVATFGEQNLPGMELENWTGMMMPAGTPRLVVDMVSALAVQAVKSPDVVERVGSQGFTVTGLGSAEFASILNKDISRWRGIIKSRQIKPD